MGIKSVKLSFLILASLVVLSFAFLSMAQNQSPTTNNIFIDSDQDGLSDQEELLYGTDPHNADTDSDGYSDGTEIKSGYDPLKPAPNDRIIKEQSIQNSDLDEVNLTKDVAQKISLITGDAASSDQEITLEKVQSIVDESLNSQGEVPLPEISTNEIKIKKQNYKNLSAAQIKEKKKEDFIKYITATYYILSSNSPRPITSGADFSSVLASISERLISSVSTGNASLLEDLSQSGGKILEQLKDVEVPEELIDIHIQALRFATYGLTLKDSVKTNSEDSLADLVNLSKIQSFVDALMNFSSEAEIKMQEYGIQYEDINNDLIKLGVPDLSQTSLKNSNAATNNNATDENTTQ